MNIAYECKFCQKPGVVTIEEYPDVQFQIDKWKPILCCNRCGDFMEKKRSLISHIGRTANSLLAYRSTTSGSKLLQIESVCREAFERLSKRLASLICDYYRKSNVWDAEFLNMLMDRPDSFWTICNNYSKSIRTI